MELHIDHARLSAADRKRASKRLNAYLRRLRTIVHRGSYDEPESSILLPGDHTLIHETLRLAARLAGKKLKTLVVVGIGGSNLGTKAIYDAITGAFDLLNPQRMPKCLFADTVHPEFLSGLVEHLQSLKSAEEVLVNVISKSGGTTETIADAEIVTEALIKRFGLANARKRIVVTTDLGSKLWTLAENEKLARLAIPAPVGGRYSVFSAVGLFPLAALGFDIRELMAGAESLRDRCLGASGNPALLSATAVFHHLGQGKTIHDTFVFHPELESLGKWVRQLVGESLGKEKNADGDIVRAGVTPTVSVGSTDLHSVGQLYLGGPHDKFTTFVHATHPRRDIRIPSKRLWPLVDGIAGKKASAIMDAIRRGVSAAYVNERLPFAEIALDRISLKELGAFMQLKMMETMFLGHLLRINAFDQPHVELYKLETKKILHG